MKLRTINTPHGPVFGQEVDMADMHEWRPSIGAIRDAILGWRVVGPTSFGSDLPARASPPSQEDTEVIASQAIRAVTSGRVIDFGFLPNDLMMQTARRAGPMYTHGAISHPFREPWLLVHQFEGGQCVYLINLLEPDKPAGGDCEIIELSPISLKVDNVLMIGDRILLTPDPPSEPLTGAARYTCSAMASIWRYIPGAEQINGIGKSIEAAAAGNVLDPFMTALMILHTKGVERRTIAPSPALARARMKNRKPPIPSYDVVDSLPYVTALTARVQRDRSAPQGGTHASPVPHVRLGHPRRYASGQVVLIPDAMVNVDEATRARFRAARSHYIVKR